MEAALHPASREARWKAVDAVDHIEGPAKVVPLLARLAENSEAERSELIDIIQRLRYSRSNDAVPVLEKLKKSTDRAVSEEAEIALAHLALNRR